MDSVQNYTIEMYLNNLEYLKKEHFLLYQQIDALSAGINSGEFQENYLLDYVDNKYFDIFSIETQSYLYGRDSKKVTEDITNTMHFDEFSNAFHTLFANQEIIPSYPFLEPTFSYINKHKPETKNFKIIPKFFFLGTLLGTHIPTIIEKLSIKRCFIYEYNIELFRLSLFVVPYWQVSEYTELSFSILDDEVSFRKKFADFLLSRTNLNYCIKFFAFPQYHHLFRHIEAIVMSNQAYRMDFLRRLNTYKQSIEKIQNNLPLLNLTKIKNIFNDKPILIIGAGPSLDESITWLQSNHNKFILVAVGASLPTLIHNKIIPDISIEIHPEEDILDTYRSIQYDQIKDIIFIAGAQTPKSLIQKYNPEKTFIFFNSYIIKEYLGVIAGQSVGNCALNLMINLGVTNLYLLGLDFALDTEGKTHSNHHAHIKKFDKTKQKELTETNNMNDSNLFSVKGNKQDYVSTTALFYAFLEGANLTLSQLEHKINVYNLSSGAFIENTLPLDYSDEKLLQLSPLDKELTQKEIIFNLSSSSDKGFSQKDILHVEKLIHALTEITNEKFDLSHDIRKYFTTVLERKDIDNAYKELIANFIKIIFHYVDGFLNDQSFSNKKLNKHIKNLNKLLYNHFIVLTNNYKEILEKSLHNQ